MRRGPGGAALPRAWGRSGPGGALESLSPPLSCRSPPGHRSARGPSRQTFLRAPMTAAVASPTYRPGPSRVPPPPPGVDPGPRPQSSALSPILTARRSPRPPIPGGLQIPPDAVLGRPGRPAPASRAGPQLGRAVPSAGPSPRIPAEVCRRSPPNRRIVSRTRGRERPSCGEAKQPAPPV